MTQDQDLPDRLRRALPAAMKARDRPAVAALRSALAAIDNAEAVDPAQEWPDDVAWDPGTAGWETADTGAADVDAAQPGFAGTVAGVGATEVERRSLSAAQMEDIVRAEIEEREIAAAALEHAGQHEPAERLRAEIRVLLSHVTETWSDTDVPSPTRTQSGGESGPSNANASNANASKED